ncbi:DUF397 domain-containing protein [Streptomyces sp. NPDC018019]|uniref:DUF397 domain-containing protein n=1 Tax=Streptomyces sp. NPDC018019 TaxID=3365030 RepID=UPI00378B07D2
MTTETFHWFKSSYSNNGGQCIEVAADLAASHGLVPVRDSKDPNGPVMTLSTGAFADLVEFARNSAI